MQKSPAGDMEKWIKAGQLLDEILDLPDEQRLAKAAVLGDRHGVGGELESLLAGLRRSSILDEPIDELFVLPSLDSGSLKGRRFGDWLLGDEIGRGGMSVVYQAIRTGERFEQRAAFKMLSIAFLSDRHIESFHRECQALTKLKHPGIAHLVHSGVADNGAPYMIIEHVDGVPIDRYCREHRPGARVIVRMMVKLCGAVAHAHRHLVVHRDINPSNVLVDHRGDPRLVDFGVAKMLDDAEAEQRLHAFTPGFAAPEQLGDATITTATDVFGLGRLLEHLLAETRDRELRAIIAVATKEDPDRRYPTARELEHDLQAWLEGRPVTALPQTAAYRARKFASRHWTWLSLGLVAVLSVAIGAAATAWQARAAQLEAAKHRAVADFMLGLFEQADVLRSGADLRVTDLLVAAADRAPARLAGQPEALASLYTLIASGQIELTNYGHAAETLAAAQTLIDEYPVSPATRASYAIQRGRESYELGHYPEAVEHLRQALGLLTTSEETRDLYYTAGAHLVSYLVDSESYGEALTLATRLVEEFAAAPAGAAARMMLTHRYAIALEVNGEIDHAFENYLQALEIHNEFEPENRLGRATILNDYGIALYLAGRFEEAETVYREVLDIFTQLFETPHPRISTSMHNLAFAIVEQDRLDETIELLKQAYAMSVELHGPEHIESLLEQLTLGNVLTRAEQYGQAEALFREAIDKMARATPDMKIQRGAGHSYLGDLLLRTNRLDASKAEYESARSLFGELPTDHPRVIEVNDRLAEIADKLQD